MAGRLLRCLSLWARVRRRSARIILIHYCYHMSICGTPAYIYRLLLLIPRDRVKVFHGRRSIRHSVIRLLIVARQPRIMLQ